MEDVLFTRPMEMKTSSKEVATYSGEFDIRFAGALDYAIRMFPRNPLVAYKQEAGFIRYI
jgi:hypothetical protein